MPWALETSRTSMGPVWARIFWRDTAKQDAALNKTRLEGQDDFTRRLIGGIKGVSL